MKFTFVPQSAAAEWRLFMIFSNIICDMSFNIEGKYGWGLMNNYPVVLEQHDNNEILINIYCKVLKDSDIIKQMLVSYKESDRIFEGGFDDVSVEIIISNDLESEGISLILYELTTKLKEFDANATCDICHENEIVRFCRYEESIVPVCETCIKLLDQVVVSPTKQNKKMYVGIIYALIGAILGGCIIVALEFLDFPYPALAGVFILYFSAKGYKISKSEVNSFTHWLVIIISILILVLSVFASSYLHWMRVSSVFWNLLTSLNTQIILNFIKDLGIAFILTATFGYDEARALNKKSKNTSKFEIL